MKAGAETSRLGELVGGKYRIARLLATGGMGVVYEAQHAVVRRRFAIKFLRGDLAERRDILTRFQREAETAGALEHENVAAAVDFGISEDGTPYIVMEYLVGESLAELLELGGPLPVSRAADLLVQACRGVAAVHAAGIVHRDLKPPNLFVCQRDDGTDLIKVLDFGVAKLQAIDEAVAATRTGAILGTTMYMSPEQARGDRTVDGRTDVYALGAILYELLSGKRPHPGDSPNAILHHIATHPAVPLESIRPDLPAGLLEVVGRALDSDPAARPPSVDALGRDLAAFARREIWPATRGTSSAIGVHLGSTRLAGGVGGSQASPANFAASLPGDSAARQSPASSPRRPRLASWGVLIAAAVAVVAGVTRQAARSPSAGAVRRPVRSRILDPSARFLSGDAPPGAVAQIESLLKANARRDAALLSAMVATPSAFWLLAGSPQQVQADVRDAVARGGREGRIPVLVPYNHPFLDCTGYGLSGAIDGAAYQAWTDAFAAGIGNEKAVVILEPNTLGLIPYGRLLGGIEDQCKPTHAAADGRRVAPPGATPEERYGQLAYAIDRLVEKAPNAAVYLDGTQSDWLPVGDAAYRLARAGVEKTAGFYLNVGNYQPTRRQIQYGSWVARCLYFAQSATADPGSEPGSVKRYQQCASPRELTDPNNDQPWDQIEVWYVEHVDHAAHPPSGPEQLTHFVINTNRNGRGPLDARVYAEPPYNQPPAVVKALRDGNWCMPPGRGLGLRPTADTRVPLVDAYLWTDPPGLSVVPCDIARGARAWDYTRYNPWGITGDAQNHFDPLWGRVLPSTGDWFPAEALELARYADPPLDADAPERLVDTSDAPAPGAITVIQPSPPPAIASGLPNGRPNGHASGRPTGLPTGLPERRTVSPERPLDQPAAPPAAALPAGLDAGQAASTEPAGPQERQPLRPTFDVENPYR